jgi:hypothetical protein
VFQKLQLIIKPQYVQPAGTVQEFAGLADRVPPGGPALLELLLDELELLELEELLELDELLELEELLELLELLDELLEELDDELLELLGQVFVPIRQIPPATEHDRPAGQSQSVLHDCSPQPPCPPAEHTLGRAQQSQVSKS